MTTLYVWADGTYCEACDYSEIEYGANGDDFIRLDLKALHWPGLILDKNRAAELHTLEGEAAKMMYDYGLMQSEVQRLQDAIRQLGGCSGCGKPVFHHLNEPFASCECQTSEWNDLDTVIMKLQERIALLEHENTALIDQLKEDSAA